MLVIPIDVASNLSRHFSNTLICSPTFSPLSLKIVLLKSKDFRPNFFKGREIFHNVVTKEEKCSKINYCQLCVCIEVKYQKIP